MRILEVIAIFQQSAGTSLFCAEVARELLARGHQVCIAVPDVHAEGLYKIEVPLISIEDAMKQRWDVVHIHGIWSFVLTRIQRWAKVNRIALVWSPHGMVQQRALRMKMLKKLAALLLYQWRSLHQANVIHVCSESERQNVARLHLHVPTATIPLGVRANAASVVREDSAKKTILYLGRINRGKGLMDLVYAWKRVTESCPEISPKWRIKVVGFNEEHYLEKLQAEVKRLGLANAIEFHGPVYGAEKDKLYAESDLFVLPSLSENFGSVLLEALMAGVPAITTTGTPWYMLPDVGCGWYVKVGVAGLVDALTSAICTNGEQLRAMGETGRRWVAANFTWDAVGKQVEQMYKNVLLWA